MSKNWTAVPSLPGYEATKCGQVRHWWNIAKRNETLGDRTVKRVKMEKSEAPASPESYVEKKGKIIRIHTWVWTNRGARMRIRSLASVIAETFVGPRPYYFPIHKDGNQENNRADNLFWGTRTDSAQQSITNGKASAKLSEKDAANIAMELAKGKNQKRIADQYGVSPATITKIKQGKAWTRATGIKPFVETMAIEEEF